MDLRPYIDSTYLKIPKQSGLSIFETRQKVEELIQEAIQENLFAVMIRPNYVRFAREMIQRAHATTRVGTVISFPEGTQPLSGKLSQAQRALQHGADELDFVMNYEAFKRGLHSTIKEELLTCTQMVLDQEKIIKWIIEIAALDEAQIATVTQMIKEVILTHFDVSLAPRVFIKTSTGFYFTTTGKPNGVTLEAVQIMLEHAGTLPIKAAGGIHSKAFAEKLIGLGVKRIGTSSAKNLISEDLPQDPKDTEDSNQY